MQQDTGSFSRDAPATDQGRQSPSLTAHAGCLGTPPNTRASFEAALAHPVDYLEADVCFTPGHVPYLAHDPLPVHLRERAMTLEELLALAGRHPRVRLNLDMKQYQGMRELARLVREAGMENRVLLTGVTAGDVASVRAGAPDLPYLLNTNPGPFRRWTAPGSSTLCREIRACGARGLNVHHSAITRCLVRALTTAGLAVSVWTVDGEREMRRMLRLGVDNITTRRVDRLIALLQEAA